MKLWCGEAVLGVRHPHAPPELERLACAGLALGEAAGEQRLRGLPDCCLPAAERLAELLRRPGMLLDLRVGRRDVADLEQRDNATAATLPSEPIVAGAPRQLEHLVGDREALFRVSRAPQRGVLGVQRVGERRGVVEPPGDR